MSGRSGMLPLMVIALSLGSALLWGTADFFAGRASRLADAYSTLCWILITGAAASAIVLMVSQPSLEAGPAALSIGAGVSMLVGMGSLYAGLGLGPMGVVAPISACSALVPSMVALAGGEHLGAQVAAGLALAFVGAVVVAVDPRDIHSADRARAVRWAVLAALMLGTGAVLLQAAADAGLSGLTVGALGRVSAGLVLAACCIWRRPTAMVVQRRSGVALLGLVDASALVLYAVASGRGHNAAVAVLSALYPVFTVALASILIREPLHRLQAVGIAVALTGVALTVAH